MDDLRQTATPLDRFLHASVGEDRNGNTVSVLSTFARLGLDPWEEATDLSRLPRETARRRLGDLLANFRDVAASGSGSTVQRLLDLLPRTVTAPAREGTPSTAAVPFARFGPILAVLSVLFLLVQAVLRFTGGSGD
jgi:hypothetical protein